MSGPGAAAGARIGTVAGTGADTEAGTAPGAMAAPRLLPLGDAAWTVEYGRQIDPALNARVMGLAAAVAAGRAHDALLAAVTDLVPTFRSLTVHFDPLAADAQALGARLLALAASAPALQRPGRQWRLPVCFDAEFGPDMARVCEWRGLSPAQVIGLLEATPCRVYTIGFLPGFAYMGGLPEALEVPRLPAPRPRVPAQTLALAAGMVGVYPWESPGGWNLLGRTPVPLFSPADAAQPALLAAGDAVRWQAVDRATHDRLAAEIARGLPRSHFLLAE